MEFSTTVPLELFNTNNILLSKTPHTIQSPFAKRNNNNNNNNQQQTPNSTGNTNYSLGSFNLFNDYTENNELLPYQQAAPEPIRPDPSFDGLVAPPGPDGTISRSAYGTPIARRSPLVLWAPPPDEASSERVFASYGNGNVYGGYPGAGAIAGTFLNNAETAGGDGARAKAGGTGRRRWNGLSAQAISEYQYARWYYIATLRTFGYDYIKPPGFNKTLKTFLEEEEMNEMGEVSMEGMVDPAALETGEVGAGTEPERQPEEDVGDGMTEGTDGTVEEQQPGEQDGQPGTAEAEDLDADIQDAEEFNYSDSEDEYDDSEYLGPLTVDDTYQIEGETRDPVAEESEDETPTQQRPVQTAPPAGHISRRQSGRNHGYEDGNSTLMLSVGWSRSEESVMVPGNLSDLTTNGGGHLHSRLEGMSVIDGVEDRRQSHGPSLSSIPVLGPPPPTLATTPGRSGDHQHEDPRDDQPNPRALLTGVVTPPPLFSVTSSSAARVVSESRGSLFAPPSASAAMPANTSRRVSSRFESEYSLVGAESPESLTKKDARSSRRYSRLFVPVASNESGSESEMSVDEM